MKISTEKHPLQDGPLALLRRPRTGGLFALLDAARSPDLLDALLRSGVPHRCLFQGEAEQRMGAAAPYLVPIDDSLHADVLLEELAEKAWGDAWGVYVTSESTVDDLRNHLRHFVFVDDHAGRELYFRFYDPRVLRAFLPTCSEAQLEALFAHVESFALEDEDPATMLTFTREGERRPATRRLAITAEQMMALGRATERQFELRVAEFLRESFPGAREKPTADVGALVRAQLARARHYGLSTERHLATYVTAAWMVGADFDTRFPVAGKTLASRDITPTWKVEWLATWAEREAREGGGHGGP